MNTHDQAAAPTDADRLWTLETALRRVREAVAIDQPDPDRRVLRPRTFPSKLRYCSRKLGEARDQLASGTNRADILNTLTAVALQLDLMANDTEDSDHDDQPSDAGGDTGQEDAGGPHSPPDAIPPDDPYNTTAQIADCVHPEGYDGECPCLTGCGCCKAAVAPHPAATQATEPGTKVRDKDAELRAASEHIARLTAELTETQATAWTPPPPGDTREQLPDHLLALIQPLLPDYTSTACQTAEAAERAAKTHRTERPWLNAHAEELHARCRTNHKFTGQLCCCDCHTDTTQEP